MSKIIYLSLKDALHKSDLDIEIDDKLKKRLKRYYEDDLPKDWVPIYAPFGTVYYEKEWILTILKTYF